MGTDGFVDVSQLQQPGIYLLCWRRTVVYVGQSIKPFSRIAQHINAVKARARGKVTSNVKLVVFDQVMFRPCAYADLDSTERYYINLYQPRFNVAHKAATLADAGFDFKPLLQAGAASGFERRF